MDNLLTVGGWMVLSPDFRVPSESTWGLQCRSPALSPVVHPPEAEKSEEPVGGSWLSGQQRTYSQDCSFKDSLYRVGDYVYVESSETTLQPHIICIERLWQDHTGGFPPGDGVQCLCVADGGFSQCLSFISRIGILVEVLDYYSGQVSG